MEVEARPDVASPAFKLSFKEDGSWVATRPLSHSSDFPRGTQPPCCTYFYTTCLPSHTRQPNWRLQPGKAGQEACVPHIANEQGCSVDWQPPYTSGAAALIPGCRHGPDSSKVNPFFPGIGFVSYPIAVSET